MALIAAATVAFSLLTIQGAATASSDSPTFVVLADDAASVDGAIASVEAAGGQVERVNRAIGLITVSAPDESFVAAVATKTDVAGVARDTPIGSVPDDAAQHRDAVEQEGRDGASARKGSHDKPVAAEPLASYQWDMRMIGATPQGSYKEQPGRKDVLVGIIDTGIDGSHPDIAPNFNAALGRNFTQDIEIIDGPCADEPDQSCDDAADVDEDGHGTHVAGTIASPINGLGMAGVAPNVSLVNLRAGQDSGYFFLGATVEIGRASCRERV